MHLKLVWIGATRDRHYRALEERYLERVSRFFRAHRSSVPEGRKTDRRQQQAALEREGRAVEAKLGRDSFLVVLNESGRQLSSVELAAFVDGHRLASRELVFVVAGHQGMPDRLRKRADMVMSLGPMTMPHELARVVLLEQLYRAATILNGLPYHR